MHEDAARCDSGLFFQTLHVLPYLLQVINGGASLFAFHNYRQVAPIRKQHIKPRAVAEDSLANTFIRMWQETILQPMRIGGDIYPDNALS